MTDLKTRRQEIINFAWSLSNTDIKRSPEFLKYLEQAILKDRKELLDSILTSVREVDSYNEVEEAINKVKLI